MKDKEVTKHYHNKIEDGMWIYYRCSELPKHLALKCPVRLKVFEANTTTDFKCQYTTFIHDHSNVKYNPKMKQSVKEKIFELRMQQHMKPKQIRKYLQTQPVFKDGPTPTIRSIRHALNSTMNAEIIPTFTFGQLNEWCEQFSKVPTLSDESFIIGYKCNEQDNSFTFVMSTLRCLQHSMKCNNIVADGTYKLNWEEYPIVAVGTIDRMQHFHMLAMCLTSNERESDYHFVFESIKNAVAEHCNHTMTPKLLVSDAAYAIRNAFYKTFPSAEQNVVCWAHVARHVHGFKFEYNQNYKSIKNDIDILQASPDVMVFKHASNLFISKWEKVEAVFCEYFKKTWLDRSDTWFGGYSEYAPATNNGNEGFNLSLKRDYTLRERLPFNIFKVIFKDMVTDLSQQYTTACGKKPKEIITVPVVDIQEYRVALSWLEEPLNKVVMMEATDATAKFLIISSKFKEKITDGKLPSSKEIKEFDYLTFEEFDDYKNNGFGMVYCLHINKAEWKTKSKCNCISFQKKTICKHVIGMALSLNLEMCPTEAKTSLLPMKKKKNKGRRAKAKSALQKQFD